MKRMKRRMKILLWEIGWWMPFLPSRLRKYLFWKAGT
jgi:hypothetical protein